jgi:hypothetical protein
MFQSGRGLHFGGLASQETDFVTAFDDELLLREANLRGAA